MTRIYKVRPDCNFRVWLTLHVSTTRAEMSKHIARLSAKRNMEIQHNVRTVGLCQAGFTREYPAEGPGQWHSDHFADMFLNEQDLRRNREIVPHECLHAALVYERQVTRYAMDYYGTDDTGMEHEERLCYMLDKLVVAVQLAVKEHAKHKRSSTARLSRVRRRLE